MLRKMWGPGRRAGIAGWVIVVLVAGAACRGGGAANTLGNPSFEHGKSSWASLTTEVWAPDFALSDSVTHTGGHSAYLKMRTDATTPPVRIWGVGQEVTPSVFPQELHGWYRVNSWTPGTKKQYMQVVVIAFGADNVPDPAFQNYQIRYILNGIGEQPFLIKNAKYVFLNTGPPVLGQWVYFKRDVAADFKNLWGDVPRNFDKVRLLFEVRFDDKTAGQLPAADAYYDDLYFGPGTSGADTPAIAVPTATPAGAVPATGTPAAD